MVNLIFRERPSIRSVLIVPILCAVISYAVVTVVRAHRTLPGQETDPVPSSAPKATPRAYKLAKNPETGEVDPLEAQLMILCLSQSNTKSYCFLKVEALRSVR